MRASPTTIFALLPFLSLASASGSINLSKFQEVAGFSFSCTDAYNTPLSGCTVGDFSNGAACSESCITQLELVTDLIDTACKGTKAFPDTLIGMFFMGKGVTTLCPNAGMNTGTPASPVAGGGQGSTTTTAGSNSSPVAGGGQGSTTTTATSSSSPAQQSSARSTTTSTTSIISSMAVLPSSTTSSSTPSSTTTTTSTSSSSPSSTSSIQPSTGSTTVLPVLTTTTPPPKPTTLTSVPATSASSSSSTSSPRPTSTSGGDKGAVGPILGVTPSSSGNNKSIGWFFAGIGGLVSLAMLIQP